MASVEGFRLKINKLKRKTFSKLRKRKLNKKDFTIISNNCWGGMVYESYNLPKMSPTVGLFFMAEDYITFLEHLEDFLNAELSLVEMHSSKWADNHLIRDKIGSFPVGKLEIEDDNREKRMIEIFFLHYKDFDDAKEKWERRKKRINYDHMLVKFNDQNDCNEELIRKFDKLLFKNKIFFSAKPHPEIECYFKVKVPQSHNYIRASYEPFGKQITKIINQL